MLKWINNSLEIVPISSMHWNLLWSADQCTVSEWLVLLLGLIIDVLRWLLEIGTRWKSRGKTITSEIISVWTNAIAFRIQSPAVLRYTTINRSKKKTERRSQFDSSKKLILDKPHTHSTHSGQCQVQKLWMGKMFTHILLMWQIYIHCKYYRCDFFFFLMLFKPVHNFAHTSTYTLIDTDPSNGTWTFAFERQLPQRWYIVNMAIYNVFWHIA